MLTLLLQKNKNFVINNEFLFYGKRTQAISAKRLTLKLVGFGLVKLNKF